MAFRLHNAVRLKPFYTVYVEGASTDRIYEGIFSADGVSFFKAGGCSCGPVTDRSPAAA